MALLDLEAGFWALRRQVEALIGPRLADDVLQQAGANGGASFARAFVGQAPAADGLSALHDCVAAYEAAGFGHFELIEREWPLGRVLIRARHAFEAWTSRRHGNDTDGPVCAYTAGVLVGFVNVLAGRQDVVCIERTCQAMGADACLFELLPADDAGDVPVVALNPNPALGRQLNLLELLFDRMPMGIAVLDSEYRIRRYNPTWDDFSARYAPPSGVPLAPGVRYFDHLPGTEPTILPLFDRALAGETIRQESLCLESEGIITYWDVVLAPIVDGDQVTGILAVSIDATGRVQAYLTLERTLAALQDSQRTLEQRVEERTHQLSTLLDVSHNVNSTLELGSLLDLTLDQLRTVVEYTGASILTLDEDYLSVRAYRGPIPQAQVLNLRFPLDHAPANREVLHRRGPIIIPNVRDDTPLAHMFQDGAGDELDTTFAYVRSWLGVPLMAKDQILGMLTLDHRAPDFFTTQHAGLVQTFANQVAAAIDNARLYQAEQERLEESERRRQVAEGLRGVLAILNSDRPLDDILDYIVEQACRLIGSQAAVVYQLALDEGLITVEAACGMPPEFMEIDALPYVDTEPNQAARDGQVFVLSDLKTRWANLEIDAQAHDPRIQQWISIVGRHFGAYLSAPIVVKDQAYGDISLFYDRPHTFSNEEIQLALSFADQAALAIENARLRIQAQEAAVAAERNRLARDLHDAVTQTLFSSSLIAEVLPRIWERNPEEGQRRLAELRELTRGALAEMRTLLLELRPSALIEAKLSDLLRQLAESITGRARVPIRLEVEGDCDLDAEVKVALYRIAQEALNNVAKHAGASQAEVRLRCQPQGGELCVHDDGLGFEAKSQPPDSLGLGIMRERAESIGATLEIKSQMGQGTEVRVVWTTNDGR